MNEEEIRDLIRESVDNLGYQLTAQFTATLAGLVPDFWEETAPAEGVTAPAEGAYPPLASQLGSQNMVRLYGALRAGATAANAAYATVVERNAPSNPAPIWAALESTGEIIPASIDANGIIRIAVALSGEHTVLFNTAYPRGGMN